MGLSESSLNTITKPFSFLSHCKVSCELLCGALSPGGPPLSSEVKHNKHTHNNNDDDNNKPHLWLVKTTG